MALLDPAPTPPTRTRPATPASGTDARRTTGAPRRGFRELCLLAGVFVAYALTRVLAGEDLAPARERALRIVSLEDAFTLDVERTLNQWFLEYDVVGLLACYYYATAHYLLTAGVLVWLWRRRDGYPQARTALGLATLLALAAYLFLPTAPPRLLDGWTDLMAVHADAGWWGRAASAPQGLEWMADQLAAFPSVHAAWALWVALVLHRTRGRSLGWAHAVATAVVVVGTGNHWVLDVLAGWAVVLVAWGAVHPYLADDDARAARSALSTVPQVPGRCPARFPKCPVSVGGVNRRCSQVARDVAASSKGGSVVG